MGGFVLLAVLAVSAGPAVAAPPDLEVTPEDFLEPPQRVELPDVWRYHPDGRAALADPRLDDTGWRTISTRLLPQQIPEDLSEAVWLRTRIRIPQAWVGRPLALVFQRLGALEVYVDGWREAVQGDFRDVLDGGTTSVSIAGDVSVITFPRAEVLLAVRFASPDPARVARTGSPAGFRAWIGPADSSLPRFAEEIRALDRLYLFFIGVAVALAILHLLLFAFLPEYKSNLYYGLSNLSVAALSAFVLLRVLQPGWSTFFFAGYGFSASLILVVVFGVMFFRTIVDPPGRIWLRLYLAIGVALLLGVAWVPFQVVYVYGSVGLLIEVWLVILAVRRRMRDAWIVLVGVVVMMTMSLLQMLPDLLRMDRMIVDNAYIYGFLGLLLSMSVYLARTFARTKRNLERRLVEVRMLSESTLEQERRAKSEEMRRVKLEEENKRQAIALTEAEKRQAMVEQLEATNRELRDTQAQLLRSEKMASLGQLVAGIAHEINTPVGAIRSVHDSLARAARRLQVTLQDKAPELLAEDRKLRAALGVLQDSSQVIESASSRVVRMVQRLRTFARLDQAELQTADLHEGLDDTLLLLQHELKHDIAVHREYGEVPPIPCFPGQLNQVFLNLLVNARQAIEGKGEIWIRTRVVAGRAHVEIADSGPGIPPELRERIFDPGFTTKGVKVGTGLGLSICYRIVQEHRGEIRLDSEVGRGTTFTVILPMDLDEQLPT